MKQTLLKTFFRLHQGVLILYGLWAFMVLGGRIDDSDEYATVLFAAWTGPIAWGLAVAFGYLAQVAARKNPNISGYVLRALLLLIVFGLLSFGRIQTEKSRKITHTFGAKIPAFPK